ncbi:spore germination protein [Halobacillus sp. BAB-2008]|uniref:spore germination protein n=1 Tax=Halobacillus sp. BAB-2008 TaxID=1246484 RepID=UPI0002A517A8|nr:spore germination protein [Halobacillus sp. BAB-2008]ELK46493.1 sopre germination protein [Halobacillus sp. BAB-2008]
MENKRNREGTTTSVDDFLRELDQSKDFQTYEINGKNKAVLYFLKTLIDEKKLQESILPSIKKRSYRSLEDLKEAVPVEDLTLTGEVKVIKEKVMTGHVLVVWKGGWKSCLLIPAPSTQARPVGVPEVEFSVVGPKEAFVESLDTNLHLVRKRLPLPQLRMEEKKVGKLTKTRVAVLYIDGIASKENVHTVLQRLEDIEFDEINDSSYISQMLSDNSNSPFPQILDTERPDRVTGSLAEGKIAILVDGAPHALTCPTTVVEFFSASDDYLSPWPVASALRLIRLFAVLFSILSSPVYVAVLTYHHEMIPDDLIPTIISSRADIPFPPILEVVILELAIELLREAGARLPTKVGQTIGIVGGIVIGTAAVDAGLTSNVLLIVVALSALASFTTPIYQISNTIRLIRFPFLIGAQMWGLIGISLVMVFFVGHLIRLTSIGRPFLAPIYPLRFRDLKDAFIRLPFYKQSKRPVQTRAEDSKRFNQTRAAERKDIDE